MTTTPFRSCWSLCSFPSALRLLASALAVCFCCGLPAHAQSYGSIPFMNGGLGASQIDFAQIYLDTANKEQEKYVEQREQRKRLVDTGVVSALDLNASDKALQEYNTAATLMKEQKAKEAIVHLQKAIAAYPKFVLAHNTLGLAYCDQQDARAKDEFETAAKLDDKFPGSFLNLGMLELQANDFAAATPYLEKAASLNAKDPKILVALAFAQNGNHQYEETLETVQRVHAIDHRGMANVHYIAASAAINLKNYDVAQQQLTTFLAEDPTNPLAPAAHKYLDQLARQLAAAAQPSAAVGSPATTAGNSGPVQTFPNSDRLRAELNAVTREPAGETEPNAPSEKTANLASATNSTVTTLSAPAISGGLYTIHKAVDETALFFAVSSHGRMVNDLELSNIQIHDDNKAPERVMQFIPQSKLPLRLGLLIDTSGSVVDRFSFEKRAAQRFLEKVLNQDLDLAFVIGFSGDNNVTQDFTAEPGKLGQGIRKLTNGGGTALFDAVSFACWKLAAYPENDRVARVLVVLTDGEDNSSHRSLKQAIAEAERAGVTIYTVSTTEHYRPETDADNILQVLAERSGGESIFPGDMQTLDKSLDHLKELIRSRYLVVYRPADFVPNGKFRPVRVAAEKKGEHLHVHVRKGYNARVEAASHVRPDSTNVARNNIASAGEIEEGIIYRIYRLKS